MTHNKPNYTEGTLRNTNTVKIISIIPRFALEAQRPPSQFSFFLDKRGDRNRKNISLLF